MSRKVLLLSFLIFVVIFTSAPLQATPLAQGISWVRVCYDDFSCQNPNPDNSNGPIAFATYVQQVLANEWPGTASNDALKAGAIAIRTFANRPSPCGAYVSSGHNEGGGIISTVLRNTQAYKIGGFGGSQNPITTNHSNAESQTSGMYLYRTDNTYACAKFNATNGNPTQSCQSASCTNVQLDLDTLQETADPVDSNNVRPARYAVGMSQNGSTAWAKGYAPWDYRQILSHYYSKVKIGTSDPNYHWVWLDVDNTVMFTGLEGQDFYGPVPTSPNEMRAGATYTVRMYIQNTGTASWNFGNPPYQLVYQWCDLAGQNCGSWSGTQLSTFSPGAAGVIALYVTAPSQVGTNHSIRWDIMKPDGTLFSSYQGQNWRTQYVAVNILSATGHTFTPWVSSAPSATPPSH